MESRGIEDIQRIKIFHTSGIRKCTCVSPESSCNFLLYGESFCTLVIISNIYFVVCDTLHQYIKIHVIKVKCIRLATVGLSMVSLEKIDMIL